MAAQALEAAGSPIDDRGFDLAYLEAELARIDVLLQREVHRWQVAGRDPADRFCGLYVSDADAVGLLERPLGSNWGRTVTLPEAEMARYIEAEQRTRQQARQVQLMAEQCGHQLLLRRLVAAFGLDPFEVDVLLIALAPALDLRYEQVYGYLQDNVTRKCPTVSLVVSLLCETIADRFSRLAHFGCGAPLIRDQLVSLHPQPGQTVTPLLAQALVVDQTIVAWLSGVYQPHSLLAGHARLLTPDASAAGRLLPAGSLSRLSIVGPDLRAPPVWVFTGPDEVAQQAAAETLAAGSGRSMLAVDIGAVIGEGTPALQAVRAALRDARLTASVLYLTGWDACLAEGLPSPQLLAEISDHPHTVITAGHSTWRTGDLDRRRTFLWESFPAPGYHHRLVLWRHYLADHKESAPPDPAAVAGQFKLTTGQIRDTAQTARDMAAQAGRPIQESDLFASARLHSDLRLGALARKIAPRFGWPDIILPDEQLRILHELVNTVRQQPLVLDEWGVGKKLAPSRGVTALFAGPPGTGKTMAAEVISADLGLDLYKIDLSQVVSKYIGETEKNLDRIFAEAETSNAILFFDEADALFGKRSEVKDAHDRYANIEISYLLQRMESYDGVTILATNLRANLDEAFTRRLHFAVNFPFPREKDRVRIWQTLFPPELPREAGIDFAVLAKSHELAGGSIRNIIVSAAYLAASDGRCVTMDILQAGIRRELQKMGRLMSEDYMSI